MFERVEDILWHEKRLTGIPAVFFQHSLGEFHLCWWCDVVDEYERIYNSAIRQIRQKFHHETEGWEKSLVPSLVLSHASRSMIGPMLRPTEEMCQSLSAPSVRFSDVSGHDYRSRTPGITLSEGRNRASVASSSKQISIKPTFPRGIQVILFKDVFMQTTHSRLSAMSFMRYLPAT